MTKSRKNTLFIVLGMLAFLFAGFFFSGCDVKYDKISLSASETSVELEVGESKEVVITINNYQKGFNNAIQVDPQSDEQEEICDCSVKYLSNDKIKLTVTAQHGGNATLKVSTLEAQKTCEIFVKVKQYAKSVSFDKGNVLYVSNDTPFVPMAENFMFDSNTTEKDMSYYIVDNTIDINFNNYKLTSVDGDVAKFNDGIGEESLDIVPFDKVTLTLTDEGNILQAYYGSEEPKKLDLVSEFTVLAYYNHSNRSEDIGVVYDVAQVNVLPSLNIKVSGGYMVENAEGEDGYEEKGTYYTANFEEVENNSKLVVVPNNKSMNAYILKIEKVDSVEGVPLIENVYKSMVVGEDYFDITPIQYTEKDGNVTASYWKISAKVNTQKTSDLAFEICYDVAQGVEDDSVNKELDFSVDIQIAPSEIVVNETSEPETIVLYNHYQNNQFGWNELLFGVISNFNTTPNFDYVYFTYDSTFVNFTYNQKSVTVGSAKNVDDLQKRMSTYTTAKYIFTADDLKKSFYVRGVEDASVSTDTLFPTIVCHLVSGIAERTNISLTINIKIVAGAKSVFQTEDYKDYSVFYVDYDAGKNQEFTKQLASDQEFSSFTSKFVSGTDVLTINQQIVAGEERSQELKATLTPKTVGTGVYRIYLDNGVNCDVTFSVIKTLLENSTSIGLPSSGNEYVSFYQTGKNESADKFENKLDIEILNPSTADEITFGSFANVQITANISANGIEFKQLNSDIISISKVDEKLYRFETKKNGDDVVTFTLKGQVVSNFETKDATLKVYVCVSSYSLIDEFYFKNGEDYATNNVTYYGVNAKDSDRTIYLNAVAKNENSTNFYKYKFNGQKLSSIFDKVDKEGTKTNQIAKNDKSEGTVYYYSMSAPEDYATTELVKGEFDNSYIFMYASSVTAKATIATTVGAQLTITCTTKDDVESTKYIFMTFSDGFMANFDNVEYIEYDEDGNVEAIYKAVFSNIYYLSQISDSNLGGDSFDMNTLKYVEGSSTLKNEHSTLKLSANIRQRDLTKRYNICIEPQEYVPIEGISLSTGETELNFSKDDLEKVLTVYTYPNYSTDKEITVEFVQTNGTKYTLVQYEVDTTASSQGLYTVKVSAKNFFENYSNIKNDESLTGVLFIYPTEWGDNYTQLDGKNVIALKIQYRNGSIMNPYLLDSVDDVLAIGESEASLKSHYQINAVIDMIGAKNATPIGSLTDSKGDMLGFSGTIVGTSSYASITNIMVSDSNFVTQNGSVLYGGLFAKINSDAVIENVDFSGAIHLNLSENSSASAVNASILTAENAGTLENVGVTVLESSIDCKTGSSLNVGAVTANNSGKIIQNFEKYDESLSDDESVYPKDTLENWKYSGQTSKNLAYFSGKMQIKSNSSTINAGGIAGVSSGEISRKTASSTYKMYGYTGYSAYALIYITGDLGGKIVCLGAGVGKQTYIKDQTQTSTISNLLVGGEVSTSEMNIGGDLYQDGSAVYDSVGGLVGESNTQNLGEITIKNNTSRTFVRGYDFVGALAGRDVGRSAEVSKGFNTDCLTNWTGNKVEMIDDGRGTYESASVIRKSTNFAYDLSNVKEDTGKFNLLIAIGNYDVRGNSSKDFSNLTSHTFGASETISVASYSARTICGATAEPPLCVTQTEIDKNSSSTTTTYGDYIQYVKNGENVNYNCYSVQRSTVKIGTNATGYELTGKDSSANDVYFMYYFSVNSDVSGNLGNLAQDNVDELNNISSASEFYPFDITNNDVFISASSSNVLTVDINGNIKVSGVGLAILNVSSLLNVNESKRIYVYVVNYFDKSTKTSLIYATPSADGMKIVNGSEVNVYGASNTVLYVIPSYTYNGENFKISESGVLRYQNVDYYVTQNSLITANATMAEDTQAFSDVEIEKQKIIFYRENEIYATEDNVDKYSIGVNLVVSVTIDGKSYEYIYTLMGNETNKAIDVDVRYKKTATSIRPNYTQTSFKTNNSFSDKVCVETENSEDHLYYQIYKVDDAGNLTLIQERMDLCSADDAWKNSVNSWTEQDLFIFKISSISYDSKTKQKIFKYEVSLNKTSDTFNDRFDLDENGNLVNDIYGNYKVVLFASELEKGVSNSFLMSVEEAEVNYIIASNYSHYDDLSVSDNVVIPSQFGMIEVDIDPVEAIFDTFTISNDEINENYGSGNAQFTFAYEVIDTTTGAISYEKNVNFGVYENNAFTFTYDQMMKFFEEKGVSYIGKVYIAYYVSSYNVEDYAEIAFNVSVTYGIDTKLTQETVVYANIKLDSYARLVFDTKTDVDGYYYVAKGLSYGLTLDCYGFSDENVSVVVKDKVSSSTPVGTVTKQNGKYVLQVSSKIDQYDDKGHLFEIETTAEKEVDGAKVKFISTLYVYAREYVLNYSDAKNEDVVYGMSNGVISTSVGTPYELKLDLSDFIEYDKEDSVVEKKVSEFMADLTSGVNWSVFFGKEETKLESGKKIESKYYSIQGYTVTPLLVYNSSNQFYHFTAEVHYVMKNGGYTYSSELNGSLRIYTEFTFEVHDQSTEDCPIPITTYIDLMSMSDDEHYILLEDIVLPSVEYASVNGLEQFTPITAQVASFDGNGHSIMMNGTYEMTDLSSVGLFASVAEDCVVKNVRIVLTGDVVLKFDSDSFNVGLLTATNEGSVTNCEVISSSNATMSVVCSTGISTAYVAGLVEANNGYITNSRSEVNMISNTSLAGFVAQNNGDIASSYFANASLKNGSKESSASYTAGFVLENSGNIYTSYVSGNISENGKEEIYYNGENNFINSSNDVSGFVYQNYGAISDCYSNIKLVSGAYASGFVSMNTGTVNNAFATCKLINDQDSNFGFAKSNTDNANVGTITNCSYLTDVANNVNVNIGQIQESGEIDIKEFSCNDFSNVENFSSFVVANGRDINSVWFFDDGKALKTDFNGKSFLKRLELVSANITAESVRNLSTVEETVDEETGAKSMKYVYTYAGGHPTLGSVYNPILISSAENMEEYFAQETNNAGYNYCYYRIINDISYDDYKENSSLYKVKFMGYLEGNFMEISNIALMSSEALNSAGLFAEVGKSSKASAVGTLLNFTVSPNVVSFANANVVGGVAGIVDGGTVVNVNINPYEGTQLVVVGNNIVGGVVGLSSGKSLINNVHSTVSAKAKLYKVGDDNHYTENSDNFSGYSFAGTIVGVLAGSTNIYDSEISADNLQLSSVASKAGLAFGLIGEYVSVEKLTINVTDLMSISAHNYGGFIAGESAGTVTDVSVVGNGQIFEGFKRLPYTPDAIGGCFGLLSAGSVSNVENSQSIQCSENGDKVGVGAVGGFVGAVDGYVKVDNINITADVTGFDYVGGVVGIIQGDTTFGKFSNINYSGKLTLYAQNVRAIGCGGFLGRMIDNSSFDLSTPTVENTKSGDASATITPATKNSIVCEIDVVVYLYENSMDNYVGSVVGRIDESGFSPNVSNTDSEITGKMTLNKMTNNYKSATMSVKVDENTKTLSLGENSKVYASQVLENNSTCKCDLEIVYDTDEDGKNLYFPITMHFYGSYEVFSK